MAGEPSEGFLSPLGMGGGCLPGDHSKATIIRKTDPPPGAKTQRQIDNFLHRIKSNYVKLRNYVKLL